MSLLQEHALSDLIVLDLTEYFAGPYCTAFFAGLGANVIKIEPVGRGDGARRIGPFFGDDPHPEKSGTFLYLNMGKKSITLDVESLTGKSIFLELLKQADVLIEDFPPGTMSALGLGYESLERINPSLVMTSISSYGQTGPYRDYKATEIVTMATSGHLYSFGDEDREPMMTGGWMSQYHVGTQAFAATMTAILYRDLDGEGQHVDVSAQECQASLMEGQFAGYTYTGEFSRRMGPMGRPQGGTGTFPAKDGEIDVALPVGSVTEWPRIVRLMGNPALDNHKFMTAENRIENRDEVDALVREWTIRHTRAEAYAKAQEHRLPFAFIRTTSDLLESRQLQEREYFIKVDHPVAGNIIYPGAPYKMSETPWQAGRAPLLGEHNIEIYCDRLGYRKGDLVYLRGSGVI